MWKKGKAVNSLSSVSIIRERVKSLSFFLSWLCAYVYEKREQRTFGARGSRKKKKKK